MSHFNKVRPTKNYRKSNYSCSQIYNSCSDKDLLILSSLCPFHNKTGTMGTHLFVLEICRCSPSFWVFRENKHHQVIHQKCLKHLQSNLTVSTFFPTSMLGHATEFSWWARALAPQPSQPSKFWPWWEKIFHMLTKICKTVAYTWYRYIYIYGRPPTRSNYLSFAWYLLTIHIYICTSESIYICLDTYIGPCLNTMTEDCED